MGAAIKNRAPGDGSSFSILDQRTTKQLGLTLASGLRDGSVFVWLLDQNGDDNPLGGGSPVSASARSAGIRMTPPWRRSMPMEVLLYGNDFAGCE